MPTLLQINTTLNCSSTGRIAEEISLLCKARGWECYIGHGGRYINQSQVNCIQISSKCDNLFHAFLGQFLGLHGLGSFFSTFFFIRKIKKINPDVIHLHNIHGYYLHYPLLFKYLSKCGKPIVWTLHDCWSFTGHCTHFENASCYKWKNICGDCPLLTAQYKSRIFDTSHLHFCLKKKYFSNVPNLTIVPVSNWLSNLVSQSFLKGHRITTIRNGIDLNLFKQREQSIREQYNIGDKKIILGVAASGWIDEKGLNEFLALSKYDQYQVIMIGVSKRQVSTFPSNIIAIERTANQSVLVDYYNAADVFVNPTYNDTLPTVNMEALACGTPVVTYNAGGSPELLSPETGVVVPRGDFKSLLSAIEEVCMNGKDFYSRKCRERAEKEFEKKDKYIEYINLYNTLLDHK